MNEEIENPNYGSPVISPTRKLQNESSESPETNIQVFNIRKTKLPPIVPRADLKETKHDQDIRLDMEDDKNPTPYAAGTGASAMDISTSPSELRVETEGGGKKKKKGLFSCVTQGVQYIYIYIYIDGRIT